MRPFPESVRSATVFPVVGAPAKGVHPGAAEVTTGPSIRDVASNLGVLRVEDFPTPILFDFASWHQGEPSSWCGWWGLVHWHQRTVCAQLRREWGQWRRRPVELARHWFARVPDCRSLLHKQGVLEWAGLRLSSGQPGLLQSSNLLNPEEP